MWKKIIYDIFQFELQEHFFLDGILHRLAIQLISIRRTLSVLVEIKVCRCAYQGAGVKRFLIYRICTWWSECPAMRLICALYGKTGEKQMARGVRPGPCVDNRYHDFVNEEAS